MRMFVCALLLGAIAFVSAAWGQQAGASRTGYLYRRAVRRARHSR